MHQLEYLVFVQICLHKLIQDQVFPNSVQFTTTLFSNEMATALCKLVVYVNFCVLDILISVLDNIKSVSFNITVIHHITVHIKLVLCHRHIDKITMQTTQQETQASPQHHPLYM